MLYNFSDQVKSVLAPSLDRDAAERLLARMLVQGFLQEDFHFTAYSTICYIVAGIPTFPSQLTAPFVTL